MTFVLQNVFCPDENMKTTTNAQTSISGQWLVIKSINKPLKTSKEACGPSEIGRGRCLWMPEMWRNNGKLSRNL